MIEISFPWPFVIAYFKNYNRYTDNRKPSIQVCLMYQSNTCTYLLLYNLKSAYCWHTFWKKNWWQTNETSISFFVLDCIMKKIPHNYSLFFLPGDVLVIYIDNDDQLGEPLEGALYNTHLERPTNHPVLRPLVARQRFLSLRRWGWTRMQANHVERWVHGLIK